MPQNPFSHSLPGDLIPKLKDALAEGETAASSGLGLVLASAVERLAAKESSVLTPGDNETLIFFASTNEELLGDSAPVVPIGQSISGFVYLTGQTTAMDKAADNPKYFGKVDSYLADKAEEEREGYSKTKEYIAAPIVRGDSVLGVLTFVNRRDADAERFSKEEIALASRYAELCGIFLDHISRVGRQAAATEQALETGFSDGSQKNWLDSPLMTGDTDRDQVTLRAEIGASLDHLSDMDLELVRSLVERLSEENLVA